MDEAVDGSSSYGRQASEQDRFLAGGHAGLEIDYVAVEYLGGLGVVVQLQGEGMVVDGDNAAEELHSVVFLESYPVIHAALHDLDVYGAGVEGFGLGVTYCRCREKADKKRSQGAMENQG